MAWESIRNLLSPEQNELLQIVTAAIKETTDDRFLPYFIDGTPPTWALIFRDGDDGYTTRKEFKQQAQEKFAHSETQEYYFDITSLIPNMILPNFNNASEFLGWN